MKSNNIIKGILIIGGVSPLISSAQQISVTPGKLSSALNTATFTEKTIISGNIDAEDYQYFSLLPATVKALDLSNLVFNGGYAVPEGAVTPKFYAPGEIPEYLFFLSKIEQVSLPLSVSAIGEGAFAGSALVSVTIPRNCERIDAFAFYECDQLSSIVSNSSKLTVDDLAFAGCAKLDNVKFQGKTRFSGKEIFKDTPVRRLDLTQAASFGDYSLSGSTGLTYVALDSDAEKNEGMLAVNPVLKTIEGTGSVVPALYAAFSPNVELKTEEGTEEIGEYAFVGNQSDLIVFMPGLEYIEKGAFSNMSQLQGIEANFLGNNLPEADEDAFSDIDVSVVKLYITEDSYSQWAAHPYWSQFDLRPGETGVDSVLQENNNLRIIPEFSAIRFEIGETQGEYAIYGLDGVKIVSGKFEGNSFVCPLPDNLPRVIIANLSAGRNSRSLTITR